MKPPALIISIILIAILTSCQQEKPKSELQKKMELDSFSKAKYGESADEHVKKMVDQTIAKSMFDTIGLSKAPVKILKSKIIKQEYSSFRNVYLQYKNVSGKTIAGIRFMWYGTNAFNEPADLGSTFAEGFGGGFMDEPVKPGRVKEATWDVLSRDAKKIKLAWPTEVSFTDGTKWKID